MAHRRLALTTVLSGLFVSGLANGGSTSANLLVRATVAPYLEHRILHEQSGLLVSGFDLVRGYKDVNAGTIASISTNSPNGYVLSIFCSESPTIAFVEVTVDGRTSSLTCSGAIDMILSKDNPITDVRRISYRFYFSQEASAGMFPWPMQLAISSV